MFGERLKALRQSRGMTQDELCRELGIVRKTLSDYENGRRYPKSTDTITKICGFFGAALAKVGYIMSGASRLSTLGIAT